MEKKPLLLYTVYDKKLERYASPLVAESREEVDEALKELNPENLADLEIIELDKMETLDDLRFLKVVKNFQPQTLGV